MLASHTILQGRRLYNRAQWRKWRKSAGILVEGDGQTQKAFGAARIGDRKRVPLLTGERVWNEDHAPSLLIKMNFVTYDGVFMWI